MDVLLLRGSEQLVRWDHTSEAAIHLDIHALHHGTIMQRSWRRTQTLIPLQEKLNWTNYFHKKLSLSRDISFIQSLLWPVSTDLCVRFSVFILGAHGSAQQH